MKKERKNILPKAALGALAAAVIVFCIMLNVEKNVLSDYEKGKVFVAAAEMEKGMVLTEENAGQYIEEKEMDKSLIPENAILQREEIYQLMAGQKLDRGVVLTRSMFTDPDQVMESMTEPVTAAFKAEDLYQVVSGILRSGDRIHIYAVDGETNSDYLIWDNIFVREVFDSNGTRIEASDSLSAAQRINILMEKENVEQFYSELSAGSLRVVKVIE